MFGSMSSGWRQDVNKMARGYFRTGDATTDGILNLLVADPDASLITLFDPCVGEGISMHALQQHIGPAAQSFGVEIDASRYLKAAEKIDHAYHGDATALTASSGWASCLWFNPPYGTTKIRDKAVRWESVFWSDHASRLAVGGLLIAILPDYLFWREDPQLAAYFARFLEPGKTRVFRAAEDTFKQIVIIGYRRDRMGNSVVEPDVALQQSLLNPDSDFPSLPAEPVPTDEAFLVPAGRIPDIIRTSQLTEEAVQVALSKDDGSFLKEVDAYFAAQNAASDAFVSVAPISDGHIPSLLASGGLNGIVEDADGRYLVRGIVQTVAEKKERETDSEKSTCSETVWKHETRIMAWDLTSHELLIMK